MVDLHPFSPTFLAGMCPGHFHHRGLSVPTTLKKVGSFRSDLKKVGLLGPSLDPNSLNFFNPDRKHMYVHDIIIYFLFSEC